MFPIPQPDWYALNHRRDEEEEVLPEEEDESLEYENLFCPECLQLWENCACPDDFETGESY